MDVCACALRALFKRRDYFSTSGLELFFWSQPLHFQNVSPSNPRVFSQLPLQVIFLHILFKTRRVFIGVSLSSLVDHFLPSFRVGVEAVDFPSDVVVPDVGVDFRVFKGGDLLRLLF